MNTEQHLITNIVTNGVSHRLVDEHATYHATVVGKGETISPPGYVTFVTDDAQITDYTVFKDIFARHGIGCTTAVKVHLVGSTDESGQQHVSLEQLKELQDQYGWEICSHGYHSNLTTLSDAELDKELEESRNWLRENGFHGYDAFMIPYGAYDARVRSHIAKYYKLCRTTQSGLGAYPVSMYELKGQYISNGTEVKDLTGYAPNTADHYKALIDYANTHGTWLILWCHSWEIVKWGMEDVLEEVVAYAAEHANMVSCLEAYELIGNIVEQTGYSSLYDDHFVIQNNGRVSSNIGKHLVVKPNSILSDTPPSAFRHNYVTTSVVTNANASGFPYNKGGILTTYAFSPTVSETSNYIYYYQLYSVYGVDALFYRRALSGSKWRPFRGFGRAATSSERTAENFSKTVGDTVYDTTLKKLVVWSGSQWTDALGEALD